MIKKYIGYYRVSTKMQGIDGNGMAAQRDTPHLPGPGRQEIEIGDPKKLERFHKILMRQRDKERGSGDHQHARHSDTRAFGGKLSSRIFSTASVKNL